MNIVTKMMKSIFAGFLIGIGGCIYLSVENKIVGSLLFSFGLMTIVIRRYYLYTGKIGYINKNTLVDMGIILIGNIIGAIICSRMALTAGISASTVATNKLNEGILELLIKSIFCGMLMYYAVDGYKEKNNLLMLIFPVMIFILCGFEHCIANVFFLCLGGQLLNGILFLIINIIGNSIGAIIISKSEYICHLCNN